VAKALNMSYKHDKVMVDSICSGLQNKDFPDDDNPYHQQMRRAGEKLYWLRKLNMDSFQSTNEYQQSMDSQTTKNDKKNWASNGASSSNDAVVTLVVPEEWTSIQAKLKVLNSAEPRLAALIKEFRTHKARIKCIASSESDAKLKEVQSGLAKLEETQDEILTSVAVCSMLTGQSNVEELRNQLKNMTELIKQVDLVVDAARLAKKKHASYISSQ